MQSTIYDAPIERRLGLQHQGIVRPIFRVVFGCGSFSHELLIAGAAEIGIGMHSRIWGRFFLWVIGGLLYLAAVVLCIVNPLLASVVLTLMLGAGLIAAGLVRAYLATQLPADQPRFMVFLAAAVTILLGLIIVSHWPLDSVYVLGTLLGVDLLFHGVGWVSFGMGLHSRS